MLEEIYIAGHTKPTLPLVLNSVPDLDAIIITNHATEFPAWIAEKVKSYLHLRFDDINHNPGPPWIPPAQEHIEKALEFAKDKTKIVVACHAGVSRSSAIAYMIASRVWGTEEALSILKPGTHWPNPTLIQIGQQMFPTERIMPTVIEWCDKNSIFLLTDDETPLCDEPPEIEEIQL
jgi:predicted protein tyrosine phosphatase